MRHIDEQLLDTSESGDIDGVKESLIKSADIEVCDDRWYYWTPLIHACQMGHEDVVKLLIDSGANVNAESSTKRSVLWLACFRGNGDIIKLLLDNGADIGKTYNSDDSCLTKSKEIFMREDIQEIIINKQPQNLKLLNDMICIIPSMREKYKDIIELSEIGLF